MHKQKLLTVPVLYGILSMIYFATPSAAEQAYEKTVGVTYAEVDGTSLQADIYVPHGEGPFPGVLMVHGGAWFMGSKSHMVRHAPILAEHGYTVVAINYRLAPKHKFPAQIEDCKQAVRWMRQHADEYKIDKSRIAAYGYSAGGHLVCLLGTTDASDGLEGTIAVGEEPPSSRVQAVVAGGAPVDFQWLAADSQALAYFLGGSRSEKPDVYRQASPTTFVTKDDPPTLFFHGESDRLVPRAPVDRMMKRLKEAGVRTELHVVAEKGHIGAFLDDSVVERAVKFLDEVLKANSVQEESAAAN